MPFLPSDCVNNKPCDVMSGPTEISSVASVGLQARRWRLSELVQFRYIFHWKHQGNRNSRLSFKQGLLKKNKQTKTQIRDTGLKWHRIIWNTYRKVLGARWGRREWVEPCHSQLQPRSPCPGPGPCSQRCHFCTTCDAGNTHIHVRIIMIIVNHRAVRSSWFNR